MSSAMEKIAAKRRPVFKLPPLTCDAHCHVFGPADKFPYAPNRRYTPEDAPKEALAALHAKLGIERAGSFDPLTVRQALGDLDVQTFWGRLAWDVDGRNRGHVVPVVQRRGDTAPIVYPPEIANGTVRYPLTDWPPL